MALLRSTFLLISITLSTVAVGEEPFLVSAVVRKLTHDPNSAPLENRSVPGKQPPAWIVRLEILQVLRGDAKLKGQAMITNTADSLPDGNGRFVVPRLNEGDVGIWAINQLADGTWAEAYSPYEVEKEIRLPLIKGQHVAYEKVLLRLSGGEASQHSNDAKPQDETPKNGPSAPSSLPVQPPESKTAPETKPAPAPSEQPMSSTTWSIIGVLIVATCGLLWLLLKRRS